MMWGGMLSTVQKYVTRRGYIILYRTSTSRRCQQGQCASLSAASSLSSSHLRRLSKDIVIIGGGLAGLSAALYLSQLDPDHHVMILDKSEVLEVPTGSFAGAGMLVPQSERLPKGQYLDLCLALKRMFPEFANMVKSMAQEAGDEGLMYLTKSDNSNGLQPWNIGYVASGGFLATAFARDMVATWAPPEDTKGTATWLDATQVRELEPNLSPAVVGGWWFPKDASADARRLTGSLRAACAGAGVQFLCGKNYEVSSLDLEEGNCKGLWMKNGKYILTKAILVANGAWMRTLLPVPIEPHKRQSLSFRMPKDRPPIG
jgi:glycine/D-amino acid oxidase-like deaminating enzyme